MAGSDTTQGLSSWDEYLEEVEVSGALTRDWEAFLSDVNSLLDATLTQFQNW